MAITRLKLVAYERDAKGLTSFIIYIKKTEISFNEFTIKQCRVAVFTMFASFYWLSHAYFSKYPKRLRATQWDYRLHPCISHQKTIAKQSFEVLQYCKQQTMSTYIIWIPCRDNLSYFKTVAVDLPLTNSSSLLHTYFPKGWHPDCEKWYKIWIKFTCPVRALGAFHRKKYLACQQRPETKNLGDDMSATFGKTGTSWVFPLTPLGRSRAGWLTVGRN